MLVILFGVLNLYIVCIKRDMSRGQNKSRYE